ncbi:SpoIID/LytB domain-containing protein [Synechococcus sp. M16CYN]|uniref:SpoIID/LytB domain-containing protein n=1 Tax=Synechococcus sp. M16CYN TaxID=3103139 RepID=UPI00324653AA
MIRLLLLPMLLGLISGCGVRELVTPRPQRTTSNVLATHRPVPTPPLVSSVAPVLWVALASHLGAQTAAAPLQLRSAGAPMKLFDGSGRSWSGVNFTVRWRSVPLSASVTLSRRIAGPFASFESAEHIAQRWRALGVRVSVAHPSDWEVWAPANAITPKGLVVRDWSQSVQATVEPVLNVSGEGDQLLKGPVQIAAPDGLLWNQGIFSGPFRLQRDAYGSWSLVEEVPIERYLKGVVPNEIGASSPIAALQAQAVLARTWALANCHRFQTDGYHLCSDTQCQVYSDPRLAGVNVQRAIAATSGHFLSREGQPINAVYHATNGGIIAAGSEAWAMQPQSYLRAAADGDSRWQERHRVPLQRPQQVSSLLLDSLGAYGAQHPSFRWSRILTADEIRQSIGASVELLRSPLQLNVLRRGESGRVLALQIAGANGAKPVVLELDHIRRTLRRLPSTLFVIEPQGTERWLIRGGGFGHGAGLSQAGAIDLARQGWSTEQILHHYYPGTVYGPLPAVVRSP